jgi:hypothetical protein
MQHEIKTKGPLLTPDGTVSEAGYATSLIKEYDRKAIKANKLRIKEWDYYFIGNERYGVALTVADNGYMGLDSISLLDFQTGFQHTNSPMSVMTLGKLNLPPTSEVGDIESGNKKYHISFKNDGKFRCLNFRMDNFLDGKPIEGDIILTNHNEDSMVIVTPFAEKETAFYYNQKINCLPARGSVTFDGRTYLFDPTDSFAVLDWGRGVWTYENTWYWGSASGMLDKIPFGFNIGYGFGDTSAASENMLFYNNKAHKLSQVTFNIPQKDGKDDFMSPWTFTSDDGRFEMDFVPVMNRASNTDFKILCSDQNQVFGKFTGKAVLDDGTVLEVKDFFGFAEKVYNKW